MLTQGINALQNSNSCDQKFHLKMRFKIEIIMQRFQMRYRIDFLGNESKLSEIHVVADTGMCIACFNQQQCSTQSTSSHGIQGKTKRHVNAACYVYTQRPSHAPLCETAKMR